LFDNDTFEIVNEYQRSLVEKYIPLDGKGNFNSCFIKSYNDSNYKDSYYDVTHLNKSSIITNNNNNNSNYTIVKCDSSWLFSKEYYQETTVTKWDLVCDKAPINALFSTLYYTGYFSLFFAGILLDKFGRKTILFGSLFAISFFNILMVIITNVNIEDEKTAQALYSVVRLFQGIMSFQYIAAVVLTVEFVGPSYRVAMNSFNYILYIGGEVIVLICGFLIRDYQTLHIAFASFMLIFLTYFWIVPESPRYLYSKKEYQKSFDILNKIAVNNNKKFTTDLETFKSNDEHDNNNGNKETDNEGNKLVKKQITIYQSLMILMKSRKHAIQLIVVVINW
jgi:MFS family permease